MIKLFTNNQAYVLILIPFIVGGHLLLDYFFPSFGLLVQGSDNLWGIDYSFFNEWWLRGLTLVVLSSNAIFLNYIFNSFEFYERLTYIPSVLYLLFVFLFPSSLHLDDILISHFFILFSFLQLIKMKQGEDVRNEAFLSGFFLVLASSFVPLYLPVIVMIWGVIFVFKPFAIRELTLPLIGGAVVVFWIYLNHLFNPNHIISVFFTFNSNPFKSVGFLLIISLFTITIILFQTFKNLFIYRRKSSIRFKQINGISIALLIIVSLLAILPVLLVQSFYYISLAVVFLPFLFSFSFFEIRKRWGIYISFYLLLIINVLKFII